jgi:hypothetical protein
MGGAPCGEMPYCFVSTAYLKVSLLYLGDLKNSSLRGRQKDQSFQVIEKRSLYAGDRGRGMKMDLTSPALKRVFY